MAWNDQYPLKNVVKLTADQYDEMYANNQLSENNLYLIEGGVPFTWSFNYFNYSTVGPERVEEEGGNNVVAIDGDYIAYCDMYWVASGSTSFTYTLPYEMADSYYYVHIMPGSRSNDTGGYNTDPSVITGTGDSPWYDDNGTTKLTYNFGKTRKGFRVSCTNGANRVYMICIWGKVRNNSLE